MGFTVPAIQIILFLGEVGWFLQSLSSGIPSLLLQSNAVFKISPFGTSLVVQWSRICPPVQGTQVSTWSGN